MRPADETFLCRLFCLVKAEELGALPLEGAAREQLMRMQFAAHEEHYREMKGVDDRLVLAGTEAVGRMIVWRNGSEIHLADISLLPEWRSRGIGGALIRGLQDEALRVRCPLRLRVNPTSRAVSLYLRMGFSVIDAGFPYRLLEWSPE